MINCSDKLRITDRKDLYEKTENKYSTLNKQALC